MSIDDLDDSPRDRARPRPRRLTSELAAIAVLALGLGGGGGVGAAAAFGADSDDLIELQRDVEDNRRAIAAGEAAQSRADAAARETELRIMADAADTQRWMADILLELSENIGRIGQKVGIDDARVRVPQLVRGSK